MPKHLEGQEKVESEALEVEGETQLTEGHSNIRDGNKINITNIDNSAPRESCEDYAGDDVSLV